MDFVERLLHRNTTWASDVARRDPGVFERLRRGQQPAALWIGCADSRVPAEVVTGAAPGELFVHRNVANLFLPDDDNSMSALEYAVRALKVGDIVVCGHYGCGGVRAALAGAGDDMPHVERRIEALRALARREHAALEAIPNFEDRVNRLAELNALEQARTIAALSVVRDATPRPRVHAWVFDIRNGLIRRLARYDASPVVGQGESTSAQLL
ncbi:MAG TPA: carbonic anhydrase [Trinickia sp.]|jgi:carbonic anhydrase|nr:carbonic anhydrase [Trinickia sp.]